MTAQNNNSTVSASVSYQINPLISVQERQLDVLEALVRHQALVNDIKAALKDETHSNAMILQAGLNDPNLVKAKLRLNALKNAGPQFAQVVAGLQAQVEKAGGVVVIDRTRQNNLATFLAEREVKQNQYMGMVEKLAETVDFCKKLDEVIGKIRDMLSLQIVVVAPVVTAPVVEMPAPVVVLEHSRVDLSAAAPSLGVQIGAILQQAIAPKIAAPAVEETMEAVDLADVVAPLYKDEDENILEAGNSGATYCKRNKCAGSSSRGGRCNAFAVGSGDLCQKCIDNKAMLYEDVLEQRSAKKAKPVSAPKNGKSKNGKANRKEVIEG
jgi:hypothetical protein